MTRRAFVIGGDVMSDDRDEVSPTDAELVRDGARRAGVVATEAEIAAAIDDLRRRPTGRITTKSTSDSIGVEWDFEATTTRRCGECTLCCKLLPIAQFESPAGVKCPQQSHARGCRIYAKRPIECATWSCRWLAAPDETAGMRRPDRSHFAIDPSFDEVRWQDPDTGEWTTLPSLQVWCDPRYPELPQDPELLAYLDRMHREHGLLAVTLRWNNEDATVLLRSAGGWTVVHTTLNRNIGNFSRLPATIRGRLR